MDKAVCSSISVSKTREHGRCSYETFGQSVGLYSWRTALISKACNTQKLQSTRYLSSPEFALWVCLASSFFSRKEPVLHILYICRQIIQLRPMPTLQSHHLLFHCLETIQLFLWFRGQEQRKPRYHVSVQNIQLNRNQHYIWRNNFAELNFAKEESQIFSDHLFLANGPKIREN